MHERGEPAVAGRQHRLDPFTQAARQYRRGAATGNRDEHWMSIDDRRRDEAAEFDIINDIDRNVRLLRGGGDGRSEERRGGKEGVSTCRSLGWPDNSKKKNKQKKK